VAQLAMTMLNSCYGVLQIESEFSRKLSFDYLKQRSLPRRLLEREIRTFDYITNTKTLSDKITENTGGFNAAKDRGV
jgi:hypothetical protein